LLHSSPWRAAGGAQKCAGGGLVGRAQVSEPLSLPFCAVVKKHILRGFANHMWRKKEARVLSAIIEQQACLLLMVGG